MPIKPLIIAVGRRGGDCASELDLEQFSDTSLLFADTDSDDLARRPPAQQLRLGSAIADDDFVRNDPDFAYKAAMADRGEIEARLAGADILLLVVGLGGGTGAGGGKALAMIARDQGLPVVACVTRPFGLEGADRVYRGRYGLSRLKQTADLVDAFHQDQLLAFAQGGVRLGAIMAIADDFVRRSVAAMLDLFSRASQASELRPLLDVAVESIFSYGVSDRADGILEATRFALNGPFFEGAAISKTRAVVLCLKSRSELSSEAVERASGALLAGTSPAAELILSQSVDPDLDNEVQVMAHLLGLFGEPLARVDDIFVPGPTG